MNYVEFLEAFVRIAEKLSPIHPEELASDWTYEEKIMQPLHHKIENLLLIVQLKDKGEDKSSAR